MNQNFAYAIGAFAGSIPYLAIVLILGHYFVRRANYQRRKKKSVPGFYPSSAALGMVFLLTQMYYRPSIQHAAPHPGASGAQNRERRCLPPSAFTLVNGEDCVF
jgi:hypothetical protein